MSDPNRIVSMGVEQAEAESRASIIRQRDQARCAVRNLLDMIGAIATQADKERCAIVLRHAVESLGAR